MKFLVIGLGSMGQRRIRNLLALGAGEVAGFDLRRDRCANLTINNGIQTFFYFEEAMYRDPDVLVVCTPPDKHSEYILRAIAKGKHCFTEISLRFDRRVLASRALIAPSCTMLFHPVIKELQSVAASDRMVDFSYHVGQYLPDWHPWEKPTDFFAGQKETSACRELAVFELSWLAHVFGFPKSILSLCGETMDVGARIDDTYVACLKFNRAFGSLLIDITSRSYTRSLRVNFTREQWQAPIIKITEDVYQAEMKAFLDALVGGKPFPNSLQHEAKVLEMLRL